MFTKTAHSFDELYRLVMLRKVPFLVVFFIVTFLSYAVLYAIDFIPEPIEAVKTQEVSTSTPVSNGKPSMVVVPAKTVVATAKPAQSAPATPVSATAAQPIKVIFDALDGKQVTVLNPTGRDVASMDQALLSGVIRHPDSADFKNIGNIFLLGHSSYLPVVHNKNFQAFNGIQNMTWGDTIRLQSSNTEYTYRVEKVYKTTASEAVVEPTPGKARLTLATCNSFGTKDDRFIVQASLVSSKPL